MNSTKAVATNIQAVLPELRAETDGAVSAKAGKA